MGSTIAVCIPLAAPLLGDVSRLGHAYLQSMPEEAYIKSTASPQLFGNNSQHLFNSSDATSGLINTVFEHGKHPLFFSCCLYLVGWRTL